MNARNDNAADHAELDTAGHDRLSMKWPPSSETDALYAVECCPLQRDPADRTGRSYQTVERLLRLWKSLGRQHPAILRSYILSQSIDKTDELVEFLDWSWELYLSWLPLPNKAVITTCSPLE